MYYVYVDAFTFSILAGAFLCSVKFEFVVVLGFIYRSLKNSFCCAKYFLIFLDVNTPVFDHFGYLFSYGRGWFEFLLT